MKSGKAITTVISLLASGSLGVDAMVFDDTILIPKEDIIASERVEIKQVGNIVEAKAPWKGEQGFTVKYDMGEPTFTDRIKDRRKQEVIYETVDFGDGGFKVDILLTEKPASNVFCYAIEGHENYDFFFQPPLTAEEIAEGAVRPPEIEGSYAVYHKTLKNHVLGEENYATGKVMHIPRPQVWEIGNEESTKQWADLSYNNGQLCVTALQDFLDNADYKNGVRIDPTFGYTTQGGTDLPVATEAADTSRRRGRGTTASESGKLDSITAILKIDPSGTEAVDVTVYLNVENTSTDSHTQVATIEQTGLSIDGTYTPYVFVASAQEYVATEYVLNILGDGTDVLTAASQVMMAYDTGVSGNIYSENAAGAGGYTTLKESPWTETDGASTANLYSLYVTYSAIIPASVIRLNTGNIRINNGSLDI